MIFFHLFSSNHNFFKVEGRYLFNKLCGEIRMATEESHEEMDLDAQYDERAKELAALGKKLPKDKFLTRWKSYVSSLRTIDRYKDQLNTILKSRDSGTQSLSAVMTKLSGDATNPNLQKRIQTVVESANKTIDSKTIVTLKRSELDYINELIKITNTYLDTLAQSQQQALRSA